MVYVKITLLCWISNRRKLRLSQFAKKKSPGVFKKRDRGSLVVKWDQAE